MLEYWQGLFFASSHHCHTKRPVVVFRKKFHAAKSADQIVEPEAGRMIQSQMINLVNGVVTRRLGATDATNDRVGACGAKLLNGLVSTIGRPAYSFPSGSPPNQPKRAKLGKPRMFLPRKGPPAGGSSAPE